MKILVTGAKGFVGMNLVENLKNIKEGKNQTRPNLVVTEIMEFDVDTEKSLLDEYCERADFVFNLAGVNRSEDEAEFMDGNLGFASFLLKLLKKYNNTCPVMLSSSVQASLAGRFGESAYGQSKLAGEELFFNYAKEMNAKVLVYRFPNLFGKWCKPNYNSVVATFCNAFANNLDYVVNDASVELELLYIDDLVEAMLDALEGKEHRCEYPKAGEVIEGVQYDGLKVLPSTTGKFCYVPNTYKATLGDILELLKSFQDMPQTLMIPEMPDGSFAKKLYSTYLSYLPESKISYDLKSNMDDRGSFTELIRTLNCGQISVNVAKPGVVKGQHWHNSKWEMFIVISGQGLIQQRKIGIDMKTGKPYPVIEFKVSGKQMKVIQMLPGYTHNIINLSKDEDLVTVIWANERFDENHPDTFFEKVAEK